MRKSLFAIGLLALSYSVQAQILCHVDTNANMYVSEGTLVYSGGGVQTRGTGILDVHGNVMIVGGGSDALRTITTTGGAKTDGGNIVLRLNTPGSYAMSTYGQLYIDGLTQTNVTGIVSKEFRTDRHGNGNYFQQIALPFFGKTLSTLSTEFGKTFTGVRWSQNEILRWNNTTAVSGHFAYPSTTTTSDGSSYYMLGSKSNNLNTSTPPATLPTIAPTPTGSVYTLNGRPYAPLANVTLQNGGNVNFGPTGNNVNQYNEKYNTYLQDQFEVVATPWAQGYGKNIYQFGNPFLTNIDLSRIGYTENGGTTDGNAIGNIWGVRYTAGTVVTAADGSTTSSGALITTFDTNGVPVGDQGLIIKPMQTFVIKLRNNDAPQTLNFNTLRRFKETVRDASTNYSVVAAKNAGKIGGETVKQLGVIALDANGKEIARTYYVLSSRAKTGHHTSVATTVQASASQANMIGTFEEALQGGYDNDYTAKYWLYINEANENDFRGKNVKLVNYDTNKKIASYKFEIRENAELVADGTHQLSSGTGFYYKSENGTVEQAKQGQVIPVASSVYDLYYGAPGREETSKNAIADNNATSVRPSRTMVVYNPEITNYVVRFDPNWKKADIEVYDMSGKLVISKKAVNTSTDFVIELDNSIKNSYVVRIMADNGETVNTKILK
ncbi:hypothetical protein HNP38_003576 [Chryseobacterium defluvii]|uniref:Secreted protein (Por secretion system target) n=1 Tax=Chryseobacterium defluvii TaxID=160396 RepID=A0A840KHP3_9FLAO|nr:T9SS type A sorting domain-containing protein [Chryseobacterium defluvii]MBB4808235.1 hypothetical protein [Chryseobacterium defluvii]